MKKNLIVVSIVLTITAITILTGCAGSSVESLKLHNDSLAMKEIFGDKPFEMYPSPVGFDLKKKYGIVYEAALRNDPYCINNLSNEYKIGWYITKVTEYWIYYRLQRADDLGWD